MKMITETPALDASPLVENEAAQAECPPDQCPRCRTRLTQPETLGWCPRCGYCRQVEREQQADAREPAAERPPSVLGWREMIECIRELPGWFWVMTAGMVLIFGVSLATRWFLHPAGRPRALWCTIQLLLGVAMLLGGQAWAWFKLAPRDARLGVFDLFISGRLWGQAFKHLPRTRRPVWTAVWGLTMVVCAMFVVGGLANWLKSLPKASGPEETARGPGGPAGKSNKSLEESVKDLANQGSGFLKDKGEGEAVELDLPPEDPRPTLQGIIIGYVPGSEGKIAGLVLADVNQGQLRYIGPCERGPGLPLPPKVFTRKEEKTEEEPEEAAIARAAEEKRRDQRRKERHEEAIKTLEKLPQLVQLEPAVPDLKVKAIWVRPELMAQVSYTGFDKDGLLVEAELRSLKFVPKETPEEKPASAEEAKPAPKGREKP